MKPVPGAPYLVNLVATLRLNGNRRDGLDLARIARHCGFTTAEIEAEFARQEQAA